MTTYRLRPATVIAERFDGSARSADSVMTTVRGNHREIQFAPGGIDGSQGALILRTTLGMLVANTGDYVIRSPDGGLISCDARLFEAAYESVDDDGRTLRRQFRAEVAP
jgi:hypothetical protein